MSKILHFDKKNVRDLQTAAIPALAEVAQQFGLKVVAAGGAIDDVKTMLKFEFSVADAAAQETAEIKAFNLTCYVFDLEPRHYKTRFASRGIDYELVGFAPRRSKFPIRARRIGDSKVVLFHTEILDRIKSQSGDQL
jgi:hypothetical protein